MAIGYFDGATDTPESARKRRDLARSLLASRAPQNTGEGIMALSNGILAMMLNGQADAAETAGRAAGAAAWDPIAASMGMGGERFPAAPSAPAASPLAQGNPGSMQSSIDIAQGKAGGGVRDAFMGEIGKSITNPYALAAIAATGEHESGFDAENSTSVWNDPSQSGQPGQAGGIMSWRGDRLARLKEFGGGDLSPAKQAAFFLQEDPALIAALGNAKSVEEAQTLMNNAWRFAGYDQPGGEAGQRLASAQAYLPQYQQGGAGQALEAMATGNTDWLRYANQGATRNLPLDGKLTNALSFLPEMGVTMEVFSGGQPGQGTGLARVGSTRHDHGNAADAFFYKDGRKLDWANPDDLPIFQEIVRRGKAAGLTGFGAGEGYMQPGSMHLGFGTPMIWGARGSSKNAPAWLRQAYETQVASLDPRIGIAETLAATGGGAAASPGVAEAPAAPDTNTRLAQALVDTRAPEMAGDGGNGGGPTMQQIMGAMSSPGAAWMPEWQQKILGGMYEQRLQQQDPAYQLGLEKARTELDLLKNPRLSPYEEAQIGFKRTEQEAAAAKAAQEQANADRSFGLDERKFTSESEDRAADNAREDAKYLLTTQPDFYDAYVKQELAAGRTPLGILEYATQLKKAGANNISVGGEPNDSALRKKLDEKTGELWSAYEQAGANSAGMTQDMEVLDEMIKIAPQGPLTGRLAAMFPGFSSAGSAFQSVIKRVAPTLRAPGSGATSDIEYAGMLESLPALGNNPEANTLIAQIVKSKAALNIERAAIVNAYGQGQISAADARRQIGEIDKRSIMTPEMRKALLGIGGEQPEQPANGGKRLRFNPDTGELE